MHLYEIYLNEVTVSHFTILWDGNKKKKILADKFILYAIYSIIIKRNQFPRFLSHTDTMSRTNKCIKKNNILNVSDKRDIKSRKTFWTKR